MIRSDAKDFLAYRIDNGLSRSAFFVPIGKSKKVVRLPKSMQGYYSKVSRKLRPYKIKHGKRKQILMGYIEKTKYISDTTREKKALALARRRKSVKRNIKRKPVKRKVVKRKRKVYKRKR